MNKERFVFITVVMPMLLMLLFHVVPATLSKDSVKINHEVDRAIQQIVPFATDRIVDEVKGLPLKIITDKVLK